jgi:hypothetical protein
MDSIEKIVELLTLLKAKTNNLLPKLPQIQDGIKPIQAPSTIPKPVIKIPGAAPSSNKDPKKVAEQLKAGQPPKASTKMKLIKFNQLGQWSLEDSDNEV